MARWWERVTTRSPIWSARALPRTRPSRRRPTARCRPISRPSLEGARNDQPRTYGDGCHLAQPATTIPDCVYGDPSSSTTVVLFGDSHAGQWFPALERLATERGWRLVSLTKSACTPAQLTVWNTTFKRAYDECNQWREAVFTRLRAERPALVIVASSHPYTSAGRRRPGSGR